MKVKFRARITVASCLLVLQATCLITSIAQAQLRAGAARVSITPDPKELPYTLGGYGDPKRFSTPATGILDQCYARALVIEKGGRKFALVSLDLCFMPANVKEAVDKRIPTTGIAPDALLLCSTHTHSGPEPLSLHSGNNAPAGTVPPFNPRLLDWIADRIAQAIVEAAVKLQPAQIGSGQKSGIGLNRNRRGEVKTDDEMTALKVTDPAGKPIAVVVDYAAHPVYFDADNLQVSGDWSGAFERMMEATMPGAVALFINGAEGDASPNGSDEGKPLEKIEVYAAKLMQPARALLDSIQPVADPKIDAWSQVVQIPDRKPNPIFILAAARLKSTPEQARAFVNAMMPASTHISFLRIGDALLVGFPGEPTTPVGLAAKQMAREAGFKHPAVVALTNDWIGYLVTAEQYKAGKYEPTMSFYGPEIGDKMLEGVRGGLAGHGP